MIQNGMELVAMAFDHFFLSGHDVVTVSTTVLPLCGTSKTVGVKGEGIFSGKRRYV